MSPHSENNVNVPRWVFGVLISLVNLMNIFLNIEKKYLFVLPYQVTKTPTKHCLSRVSGKVKELFIRSTYIFMDLISGERSIYRNDIVVEAMHDTGN